MNDSDAGCVLPEPITVDCANRTTEDLLTTEWLLTNRIGAYASSTVLGCNVRRYHGLLVAATRPPVGRIVILSSVMETLCVGDEAWELATNEFPDAFAPLGRLYLRQFRNDVAATFVYQVGPTTLTKQIALAADENAVVIRYSLTGLGGSLHLRPFVALRDYHHLRRVDQPHQIDVYPAGAGIAVRDGMRPVPTAYLRGVASAFERQEQWWYRFSYRKDIARGQEGLEDLCTPGVFHYDLADGGSCEFSASLSESPPDFAAAEAGRRARLTGLARSQGPAADESVRRLAMATDAFVVRRSFPESEPSTTIVAGYPWFADWGRDAFVALPGLLLATGRFGEAREVFSTFARFLAGGLVPNRFDDYSTTAHYNSIDASLWFILAAQRFLAASGDMDFWRDTLLPTAQAILTAYREGTSFGIHADADGLIVGGGPRTQLSWMDVALGDEVVTPRHGKPVEVNALWYCAHRFMGEACRGIDDALARFCADEAGRIGPAFARAFWNGAAGCLYDCIGPDAPDGSIRPNQIFAVSLPYSPLSRQQQADVVRVVTRELLTPMGLRTLSPRDGRYRRRYGGSWESRDRAYHQGTVWAWLMGPFIDAYLKVEAYKPFALAQAAKWLQAFDGHLNEVGLGTIGEIFDGDPPHRAKGCIAQAWSVAEILRAKRLVTDGGPRPGGGALSDEQEGQASGGAAV